MGASVLGDWDFYWGQFLDPTAPATEPTARVSLPGSWVDYPVASGPLSRKGHASYRLEFLAPRTEVPLGLDVGAIVSAVQLYLNGRLLLQLGRPGDAPERSVPKYDRRIVPLPPELLRTEGVNVLVLHVSSHEHHHPGPIQGIRLDRLDRLYADKQARLALDLFVLGGLVITALYHYGLFLFARRQRSTLHFANMLLCVTAFCLASSNRFIYELIPTLDARGNWFLYFLGWNLGVTCFLAFTRSIFPRHFPLGLYRVLLGLCLVNVGLILALPVQDYMRFTLLMQGSHLLAVVTSLSVVIRAGRAGAPDAGLYLAAILLAFAGLINDMLYAEGIIHTFYMSQFALYGFTGIQALLLARRFSRAFQDVERYSAELATLKTNLERQVEDRTAALQGALKAASDLNQQLEHLSQTDALTALFNRRFFNDRLSAEWRRGTRGDEDLSLILIDIDHFKQFNDRHGHLCGDACLRHVGGLIRAHLARETDLAARYGGEEFAILLSQTPLAGAQRVAQRLCEAVAESPLEWEGSHLTVTLSAGVASLVPDTAASPDILIRRADGALYQAKLAGRNQVQVADDLSPSDPVHPATGRSP